MASELIRACAIEWQMRNALENGDEARAFELSAVLRATITEFGIHPPAGVNLSLARVELLQAETGPREAAGPFLQLSSMHARQAEVQNWVMYNAAAVLEAMTIQARALEMGGNVPGAIAIMREAVAQAEQDEREVSEHDRLEALVYLAHLLCSARLAGEAAEMLRQRYNGLFLEAREAPQGAGHRRLAMKLAQTYMVLGHAEAAVRLLESLLDIDWNDVGEQPGISPRGEVDVQAVELIVDADVGIPSLRYHGMLRWLIDHHLTTGDDARALDYAVRLVSSLQASDPETAMKTAAEWLPLALRAENERPGCARSLLYIMGSLETGPGPSPNP